MTLVRFQTTQATIYINVDEIVLLEQIGKATVVTLPTEQVSVDLEMEEVVDMVRARTE